MKKNKTIKELTDSRDKLNKSFNKWLSELPPSVTGKYDIDSVLSEERERMLTPDGIKLIEENKEPKVNSTPKGGLRSDPFRKRSNDPRQRLFELSRRISDLEARVAKLESIQRTPRTKQELEASVSTWSGWPENEPKKYNGSGTPCDMYTGPCQCGAFHVNGK